MKKKPALPLSGLCVVIALMAACGTELDRTNAYDQMTAAEQQATGALLGRVQLEGEHDYAGVDVRAEISSGKIFIPRQLVNGYEIEGVGSLYLNEIQFNYKVRDTYTNRIPDYCEATAWVN